MMPRHRLAHKDREILVCASLMTELRTGAAIGISRKGALGAAEVEKMDQELPPDGRTNCQEKSCQPAPPGPEPQPWARNCLSVLMSRPLTKRRTARPDLRRSRRDMFFTVSEGS